MFTPLFILAFTAYLLSVALALVGVIFSAKIPAIFIRITIVIHFMLLSICILFFNRLGTLENPSFVNILFLSFFCLGIIASGIIIRAGYPLYLKLYFLLFIISIPVFIVTPSRVLGFVVTGDIHSIHRNRIHITDNYFLVAQTDPQKEKSIRIPYKLVKEIGMFHRTLQRDIVLPEFFDSVRIIEKEQDSIRVRFFFSMDSIVDSLDQSLNIKPLRDSSRIITRQPKKSLNP